jgi:hypothetical protein
LYEPLRVKTVMRLPVAFLSRLNERLLGHLAQERKLIGLESFLNTGTLSFEDICQKITFPFYVRI